MRNTLFYLLLTASLLGQGGLGIPEPNSANFAILKLDYQTYDFEGAAFFTLPPCPACPRDSLPLSVANQPAVDFGSITFMYSPTTDTLFHATIIWMGEGAIYQPDYFFPPDSFVYLDSLSITADSLYAFQASEWGVEWYARADSAWNAVRDLNLDFMGEFAQHEFEVGLYLYPPTVGAFDPNPAKWIVIVYQDLTRETQSDTLFALSFFPLQIGNRWQYAGYSYPAGQPSYFTGYESITVGEPVVLDNGKSYYSFFGSDDFYLRIDTTALAVMQYNISPDDVCTDSEFVFLDLSQIIDSSQAYFCNNESYAVITQTGLETMDFIPGNRPTITYEWWHGVGYNYTLTEGIGLLSYGMEENGSWQGTLIAATINGVQYGEFVATEQATVLPKQYVLHPNYPNPFNPVTTIRYELPEQTAVKLAIYDILGQEVAVLVDEQQAPGIREVKFDARNLASDIYFYRLTAPTFTQTRKLVVLK
ncbi:MAG: T9SS type A sorting domain-containing protein [Fidelibacterota bacterium]